MRMKGDISSTSTAFALAGGVAAAADTIHLAVRGAPSGALLLSFLWLSLIVFAGSLGAAIHIWLVGSRSWSNGRPRSLQIALTGLPLAAFLCWVPSSWVVEHWPALGALGRAAVAGSYPVLLTIAFAAVRVGELIFDSERSRGVRLALGTGAVCLGLVLYLMDATILVGLYWEFHVALAMGSLLATGCGLRLLLARRLGGTFQTRALLGTLGAATAGLLALSLLRPWAFTTTNTVAFPKLIRPLRPSEDLSTSGGGSALADGEYPIPNTEGFNVVLFTIDTVRGDHVGFNGYERPTTPHIDQLAARGITFRNAYSQAPKTGWSMPSLYTGLYPSNIDDHYDDDCPTISKPKGYRWCVGDGTRLVAEDFLQRGYSTAGFLLFSFFERQRLDRGFETVVYGKKEPIQSIGRWLDETKKPFYLAAHIAFPHHTYEEHRGFSFGSSPIDRYDSEIAYSDEQVGRLVKRLERDGLLEKTVFIVTSDHGEEFHEHGGEFHSNNLYQELLHVPLIVVIPGVEPQTVDTMVELVDVVPTLNDLFGLGHPAAAYDGQSLLATLAGQRAESRRGAYSQRMEGKMKGEGLTGGSLITPEWHGILMEEGSFELYDVVQDPKEQRDIASERPELSAKVKQLIRERPLRAAPK